MLASALVLGVGVLAACTPKPASPPPPAPIAPPQPPPPSAHLSVSPASATLATEATYGTRDTGDFTVTNDGNATSGPVAIDLSGLTGAFLGWQVSFDLCTGRTLAPSATCFFEVEPHALEYTTATTGPANFMVTAGAGVSANVSMTGTLTSDLLVDASSSPLFVAASTLAGGTGTASFNMTNDSSHPIGPLDFGVTPNSGGVGTWALAAPSSGTACTARMTLAAGASCSWALTYTNNTGAGTSVAVVSIDGDDGSHATGAAFGVGTP